MIHYKHNNSKFILLLFYIIFTNNIKSQSVIIPSTYSGLKLWLTGDSVLVTNQPYIDKSFDLSTSLNDALQTSPSAQPSLFLQGLNGHNIMNFDGIDDYLTFNEISDIRTVFWVVKEKPTATPNYRYLLGNTFAYQQFMRGTGKEIWNTYDESTFRLSGVTKLNHVQVDGTITNLPASFSIISLVSTGNMRADAFTTDRLNAGRVWDGSLAELIIYNQPLANSQVDSIENYLHRKYAPPVNLGADKTVCTLPFKLKANKDYILNYLWQDGSTADSMVVNSPGIYYLTTTDVFNRVTSDTINIALSSPTYTVNLGNDTTICSGKEIILNAGSENLGYVWSNGSFSNIIYVNTQGTYSVSVTDCSGNITVDSIHVTIQNPPVFNFGSNDTTICGNAAFILDSGFGTSSPFTFHWQDNSNASTHPVLANGQYYLDVTDNIGCKSSDSINIQIDNSLNNLSLGPDVSLCGGNFITLTSGISPSLTYTWNTGSNNDSLQINTSGQYSIAVTNTNNCVAIDSISVTVQGYAPTANFVSNLGCVNSFVSFSNLSFPPTSDVIDSTFWNFGDGLSPSNTSTLTNPAHTYANAGTYTVSLRVKTDKGCEQTVTKSITIHPKPTAEFIYGSACLNDSTIFTNQSSTTSGYSITSLSWNFGDLASGNANISNLQQVKHVFNTQANYDIKLIAINNVGCKDSMTESIFVAPCTQTINLNGLSLWLKADYGVVTLGSKVTSWLDASGNNNHCIQPNVSEQPTFNQNIASLNYKNSIVFDGIDDWIPFTNQITDIRTVFFLIKHAPAASNFEPLLGDASYQHFQGDDNPLTNKLFHPTYASPDILNSSIRVNQINITPVASVTRPSNYAIVSLTTTANVIADRITRDRGIGSRVWAGEYCEIIIYDHALNASEVANVETYLINKYGGNLNLGPDITVNQSTGCTPSNPIELQAPSFFRSYKWSTGVNDTLDRITANQYGQYSVICKDNFGIFHYDTIKITPPPMTFNYPSNILCANTTIKWNTLLDKNDNFFSWQDGSNDSLIVINAPGQYSVTVTDIFGCVYNSNIVNIIQDNFEATVSLGPDDTLCLGNSITLTSGLAPALTYTWSDGSHNSNLPIAVTGQYYVAVTNTNGCVGKDTIDVTIGGVAPIANFTTTIGCLNKVVSFTNLSSAPIGNTIADVFWDFGEPTSATNTSTVSNPSHTYTNTGTYNVNLNVVTNGGCEQNITKTITVYPAPTATFAIGTSCQNDSTTFLNQSTGTIGYSITNSYWNFGDASSTATTTIISPKHMYTNASIYTVKLLVTNSVGCKDSIYKTVAVNNQVKANFTNGPACLNAVTAFQSTSIIPPSGSTTYSWTFPGSTATVANPIRTFTNSGVYPVTLFVDGTNGCTSTITKLVNVYLSPITSFSIQAFCAKDTTNIINLSNPQSGIISSYNWKLNNITFSSVQSPTLSLTNPGNNSVRLTTINSFGCKDSTTNSLIVFPLPVVDFSTTPTAFYFINEPINFTPSINNASSYLWNMNTTSTYSIQNPTETFNTEGSFNISLNLKDQNGCKGSKTKNITINERYLDLAVLKVNTNKDNNGFMTVVADIANYGSVPINSFKMGYQISDGGTIKETWNGTLNPNSFYTFTFNAESASTQNSVNNITCVEIEKVNTSIDDNTTNNSFCNSLNTNDIYVGNPLPNPTDGDIVLPITLNKDIDFTISIYNSVGKIQYEETTKKGIEGLNFVKLNTSSYARGAYIIKLMIDEKIFIKKFIKISYE
jgi:PKD repeat protein